MALHEALTLLKTAFCYFQHPCIVFFRGARLYIFPCIFFLFFFLCLFVQPARSVTVCMQNQNLQFSKIKSAFPKTICLKGQFDILQDETLEINLQCMKSQKEKLKQQQKKNLSFLYCALQMSIKVFTKPVEYTKMSSLYM